jgi:6,7-dimethyl-8-ribityllumazine synthase
MPQAVVPVVEEVSEVEEVPEAEVVVVEEVPGTSEHAPGTLVIPPAVDVLEGGPHGFRRTVAVVVSRFNGDITTGLLESALSELRGCSVSDDAITVVPVPGAFELPLTALALAKTRRFSCVVALGCIIRGETPHFDLIASEAASGLQLAAIETGIPVAFGVITTETREQAEARIDRGAEAARTALEMADLFSHVRTRAAAT